MGDICIPVDTSSIREAGHHIAAEGCSRVMLRHQVHKLITYLNPWARPDLDHSVAMPQPAG